MNRSQPLFSLHTVTQIAAYVSTTRCSVQFGWRIKPTELRLLAARIGPPVPTLRRVQNHLPLAGHLALALAADLITLRDETVQPGDALSDWLERSRDGQFVHLLQSMTDDTQWQAAIQTLRLSDAVDAAYRVFIVQQLERARAVVMPADDTPAQLHGVSDRWDIIVRPGCPARLLYQACHIADVQSTSWLRLTPVTLGRGVHGGFPRGRVATLLAALSGKALRLEDGAQLAAWLDRCDDYRIAPVYLLTTRRPEQLQGVLQQRMLRERVWQAIGSRHAVVSPDLITPLERWLAKDEQVLAFIPSQSTGSGTSNKAQGMAAFVALRVLQSVLAYVVDDVPGLAAAMTEAVADTAPEIIAEWERRADRITDDLVQAIRGRDALQPARQESDSDLLYQIQTAVAGDELVTILYQGPGDVTPRRRTVQPLWIETRGNLHYVHAYCYLAEADRVFRLDRIRDILVDDLDAE